MGEDPRAGGEERPFTVKSWPRAMPLLSATTEAGPRGPAQPPREQLWPVTALVLSPAHPGPSENGSR